ncbi:lantibiotic dehydratase [Streptomyces kunmingensis]
MLRAAAVPVRARPVEWPDTDSPGACRQWLAKVWSDEAFVLPLRAASAGLAGFVEQRILCDGGDDVPLRRLRKVTDSVARYLLRASARATPFGLFAGVALAECGPISAVIGPGYQALARRDAQWVDHVRRDLQRRPDVLPHLTLQVNSLSFLRGDIVSTPRAGGRLASAPVTRPLAALLEAAVEPVPGRHLIKLLTAAGGTWEQVVGLIAKALADGYLTSNLAAPMTAVDPARHIGRILRPHADQLDRATLNVLDCLSDTALLLALHDEATDAQRAYVLRGMAEARMRAVPSESRSRISLDLCLDAQVAVPRRVLDEVERAADALVRLTRTRGPSRVWAAYRMRFEERYGAGVLVPVCEAVDLAAGVGLPAGYPMSMESEAPLTVLARDEQLAARAMQAAVTGEREVVLTEEDLNDLAADEPEQPLASHAEIGFRIRATSQDAVTRGDFTIDVRPAWAAGVLSGRFATVLGGRLAESYRTLPTMTHGALPAQLSFTPVFPHAQNVARIPAFLPYVIPVGESHEATADLIDIDDLAVISTGGRMHLVSLSRRRIVEPSVFHPLALEKQAPPLARFLAMLGRGFATAWTAFDWGPAAARLPYLPRVRYGRAILAPARWQLSAAALPYGPFDAAWHKALSQWALTWHCPPRLELLDADRTMSVDLAVPLHARLIHQHLRRHRLVRFAEAPTDEELGWIGHAHEFTVPLAATGPQAPHPDLSAVPVVTNRPAHPQDSEQRWLQVKVFTHPTAMDQIIGRFLPRLVQDLGTGRVWFVRYRSPQESDHLRIRVPATGPDGYAAALRTVSAWARQLTVERLASHHLFDAYRPEIGRYGTGAAMDAAEDVFVADTLVTSYALTDVPALDRETACALSMIDMAEGFLGTRQAMEWMAATPAPGTGRREVTRQTVGQVNALPLLHASDRLAHVLAQRRAALGAYRDQAIRQRGSGPDAGHLGPLLESLLHMLHNRLVGPDRDSEAACRHAARQACRSLLRRQDT